MINFSIKTFIKLGVHISQYVWDTDNLNIYYLLGTKNNIQIINLHFTLFLLKRALYIVKNAIVLNQKILLINSSIPDIKYLDQNYSKYVVVVDKRWTGGLLTNHKHLRVYNKDIFFKYPTLKNLKILPSFCFISSPLTSKDGLNESMVLDIPTSTLIESSLRAEVSHYSIPGNFYSLWSRYIFQKIFGRCGKVNHLYSIYRIVGGTYLSRNKKLIWEKSEKENKINYIKHKRYLENQERYKVRV